MESSQQPLQPAAHAPARAAIFPREPALEGSGFARLSLMVNTVFGVLVAVDVSGTAQSRPRGAERPAA